MSLFDNVLGTVLGGITSNQSTSGTGGNDLLHSAMELIQQQGGLPAVVEKFRQGGFAKEAESWIGSGQNLPISADALKAVLGSGAIDNLAARLGLPADQVNAALSSLVPHVIDKMTPNGTIADGHEQLLQQGLSALAASLGVKPTVAS